jgi:HD-GYP domain-containing protein (c-di-GMP phosphodiesterase class II)
MPVSAKAPSRCRVYPNHGLGVGMARQVGPPDGPALALPGKRFERDALRTPGDPALTRLQTARQTADEPMVLILLPRECAVPKKIPISQLRVGMFLHGLEGNWLDHPFWRNKFLIRKEAELDKLRASGLTECWIDPSKGEDVTVPVPELALAEAGDAGPAAPATAFAPAAPAAAAPPERPAGADLAAPPSGRTPTDFVAELNSAALVIDRARVVVTELMDRARLGQAVDAERCIEVVDEITDSIARNHGALISLLRLKRHDDYSYLHSVAVCALMVSLARELHMGEAEVRLAGMGGLVHDVGKSVMPTDILLKPGKLTDEEFAVMKTHPERGHALLKVGQLPPEALDVCLHHHERMDGKGYPHGLAGEAISRYARMGAICDVYDAVTSSRPYKNPWDPAEAIARMASWEGHFDPALFSAFVRCLGMYPTGSLVRLQSDRLAVVLEQNPGAMSDPVVRVFYCTVKRQRISPEKLDLASAQAQDFIVSRESAADWPVGNIEALWSHGHAGRILGTGGAQAGRPALSGEVRG